MIEIVKELNIEVSKPNVFQAVVAKQYDMNTRFIKATLVDGKDKITIDPAVTVKVVINALRPDGESRGFEGVVNEDGTVKVPLHSWMLELDGTVVCDISVIDIESDDNKKLTTTSFTLIVEKAAFGGDDITTDPQYDVLVQLLEDCSNAGAAAEEARSKTQLLYEETLALANVVKADSNAAAESCNEALSYKTDAEEAKEQAVIAAATATEQSGKVVEYAETAQVSAAKAVKATSNKVERKVFFENMNPTWIHSDHVADIMEGFYTTLDSSVDISDLRVGTQLHIKIGSSSEIYGGLVAQIVQAYEEISNQVQPIYNEEIKCYECTLTVEKQPTTASNLSIALYTLVHYDRDNPLGELLMSYPESEGYYELKNEQHTLSVYKNTSPVWQDAPNDETSLYNFGIMTVIEGVKAEENSTIYFEVGWTAQYEPTTETPDWGLVKKTTEGGIQILLGMSKTIAQNGTCKGEHIINTVINEGDVLYLTVNDERLGTFDTSQSEINISLVRNTGETVSLLYEKACETDTQIGNIESALDGIIAVQNNLIGGGSV